MSERKPEQLLWDDLRTALAGRWLARRIEDRLGPGLPDLWFGGKKKRGAWMELKVLPTLPREGKMFDIPHFTADQRAFGLACLEHTGTDSWFLMTRCGDLDHLHRASVIDSLGEVSYRAFRSRAAWVGRISLGVSEELVRVLLR